MATLPRFPKADEETAMQAARDHDHRFTVAPWESRLGEETRRSWRCLDCGAHVIVYYRREKCLGADGSAITTFCESVG